MTEQTLQQHVGTPQVPPPNYLVVAILTTLFCCLPFGVISIVFAAQVNSKWLMGDHRGAMQASKNAKLWAWVSFGTAIILVAMWFALIFFGVIAGLGLSVFEGINV